jgi:hypothetical protein
MTIHQFRANADAEAAHATLAAHVPDQESGLCGVCRTAGPCPSANAAANHLVDLGLAVLAPAPVRPTPAMLARLAPLLSHGWRRRLGLLPTAGGG